MDIEAIVNDELDNIVPMHLRGEGVDVELIKQLVAHLPNDEIYSRLNSRMNPETRVAAARTLEWLSQDKRTNRFRSERTEIYWQLEAVKQEMKEIFPNGMFQGYFKQVHEDIFHPVIDSYRSYLSRQGLPEEKITASRMFMLFMDILVAKAFNHDVENVKPDGFGPYAAIGYPLRTAIRYFMLQGAQNKK